MSVKICVVYAKTPNDFMTEFYGVVGVASNQSILQKLLKTELPNINFEIEVVSKEALTDKKMQISIQQGMLVDL